MDNKTDSVAFILGAGASHGEILTPCNPSSGAVQVNSAKPPLLNGFFSKELYDSMGYSRQEAEKDFERVFQFLRESAFPPDPKDENGWSSLNIENVFTSIEIERGFQNPESDYGAWLLRVRNGLVRYVGRILSRCTLNKYGEFSRRLVSCLHEADTLITFNWDLLLDAEVVRRYEENNRFAQYKNLMRLARWPHYVGDFFLRPIEPEGLFLKLHGSLGWFECTNSRCPESSVLMIDSDVQKVLEQARRDEVFICHRCANDLMPVLIPPILEKPIHEDWMIRAFWNFARQRLSTVTKAVLIGFSAAPTDFYAGWLLRSTLGKRQGVELIVVNPENDAQHSGHDDFSERMSSIFPRGYNSEFRTFSQIDEVLERVGRAA